MTRQDIEAVKDLLRKEAEKAYQGDRDCFKGYNAFVLGILYAVVGKGLEKNFPTDEETTLFIHDDLLDERLHHDNPTMEMLRDLGRAFISSPKELSLLVGNSCPVVSLIVEYRMKVQR